MTKNYPMWNADKTGIIVLDQSGIFRFVSDGPEFDDLKNIAYVFERDVGNPIEDALQAERAAMICSPMQGMLALGETRWAAVQDYRDNHATWAERVIIDRAGDWRRTSQNIAFFQFLLGMTDEDVDDLFRLAMTVDA
jgi:hypothetical protein